MLTTRTISCINHPYKPARCICSECKQGLCKICYVEKDKKYYCKFCAPAQSNRGVIHV